MKLSSQSFAEGERIPGEFAFAIPDAARHVALSRNRNPHLRWSDAPDQTKSFALICSDPDAPSQGDDVNQEGRTVAADLLRVEFIHWLLIDLPADLREIAAGAFSATVTPRGKPGPNAPLNARQGVNDYTGWFANDHDMCGDYYGYDGPCPPWNDARIHRYIFTLYALDVASLSVSERLTAVAIRQAMRGHILAEANLTGVYTLNPSLALAG
ncbi:MAG: YbhB/YbcL family Raf kinase inhibitor-like protein [Zoogloeaceae bacterium]|jgi:Raf kinase inhibitor-like YbhB/YbcL family protein|nr:YbhB/YbcL family Raf kinase inhibitor-like protein [Zoogloeaceae bacterium]